MIARKSPAADLDQFRYLFLSIGLVVSLAVVNIAFEWKFYDNGNLVQLYSDSDSFEELMEVPITQQPPPPPPQKNTLVTLIEVPDVEDIDEEITFEIDIEVTEDMLIEHIEYEEEVIEEDEADEIFTIVEKAPAPKNGMAAFYQFVSEELKYPRSAMANQVQGKVFVQFVVDKNGLLKDFAVVKGIGFGCDEEAIRVLKKSPIWEPGKQRGVPVNVRMILPIRFMLQ